MTRQNWADMSRQELLWELANVSYKIGQVKVQLRNAHAQAKEAGKPLAPETYQSIEDRRRKLAKVLFALQQEVARRKNTREHDLLRQAKELLKGCGPAAESLCAQIDELVAERKIDIEV